MREGHYLHIPRQLTPVPGLDLLVLENLLDHFWRDIPGRAGHHTIQRPQELELRREVFGFEPIFGAPGP